MTTRSNLFVTSHADGSIILWDKDKEDWTGFVPQPYPPPKSAASPVTGQKENEWPLAGAGAAVTGATKLADGQEDMVVSKLPPTDRKGQSTAKFNPVSHWHVSKKPINGARGFSSFDDLRSLTWPLAALAFSPDLALCAAAGEDGCLRIIDAVEEKCVLLLLPANFVHADLLSAQTARLLLELLWSASMRGVESRRALRRGASRVAHKPGGGS